MDIRNINTINRIEQGLIRVLAVKKLNECTTIDIINQAEISKKTFYNHFKNKQDFLHQVEADILTHLRMALAKDRQVLRDAHQPTAMEIIQLATSAFDRTLQYCEDHKEELAALLSDNGDINLYHSIVTLAKEEFNKRAPYLFGIVDQDILNSPLYSFFQTIYVDSIINLLSFWLHHRDKMSIDNVKYLAGVLQTKSPMELMQLLAAPK